MRVAAWLGWGYGALLLAIWLGVSRGFAIAPAPPLGADEAAATFRALRAAVDGSAPARLPPGTPWSGRATLFCDGKPRAQAPIDRASDGRLDGADGLGADPALRALDFGSRNACRIKLDIFRGTGSILPIEPLLSLSVVPGVDGLGLRFGDRDEVLTPDDLIRVDALGAHRPFAGLDLEVGLDARAALRLLALRVGADPARWRATPHRLYRVRVEGWVERADPGARAAGPLPVVGGNPPGPAPSTEALRAGALAGARWLAAHLGGDGRFVYQYDAIADEALPDDDGDYSVPRHAGAAYYLAQAAGATGDRALGEAAGRAIGWLVDHRPPGCERAAWACAGLPEERAVDLGSSALALLAAVEHRAATGDDRFLPFAVRLASFLLAMQRPDGELAHRYDLEADARDDRPRLLYYSGEAAFALARLGQLARAQPDVAAALASAGLPSGRLADAVDRALFAITARDYDHFAGSFFFGEEHWTCLAVDAAWELLPAGARRDGYGDFCEQYARFLERQQYRPGEGPARGRPELVGSYGVGPFAAPHPTPIGSRAECLVSAWRIARRRGHERAAEAIASQLRLALAALLARQGRADGAWLYPSPAAVEGAFPTSDVQRRVRIDYVQHACSAMLRASLEPALASRVDGR